MKSTFAKITIASFLVCASACVSTTPVSSSSIAASVAAIELAPDEEAADEWVSDCRQELGRDSGVAARAHLIDSDQWVNGCFVNGDDVDGFVIEAPATNASSTFQIELIHRGGAALEATLVTADGKALAGGALVEGAELNQLVVLEPGSRTLIRVAKSKDARAAWYRLKATPVTQVATK